MKVTLQNLTKKYPSRNKKQPQDVIAVNDFSMEIPDFLKRYDPELLPDALAFAARVGRKLAARLEAKKGCAS